jgi:hypothetical protein
VKEQVVATWFMGFFVLGGFNGALKPSGAQNSTSRPQASVQRAKDSSKLQAQAKISIEQARVIALKKVPGEVKESELEKEHGKLVYSFDIQGTGDKDVTEVQVSAIDGSIVRVEKESAESEAKEKKREQSRSGKTGAQPAQKPPQ